MDLTRGRFHDSKDLSNSTRLRIFTKMLREPLVVSGSAYRSGAHPILACRVAAEVARSPKLGLVERLMEESRQAFLDRDYPTAIVKSLAAEELLRKYGGILAPEQESQIRDQLQFLKIQYFLLSGQAGEAFKVMKDLRVRSHPYLWHTRMAVRTGVSLEHWEVVERMLRQIFVTNRSGKIFALLGYAIVMGESPTRLSGLAKELDFKPAHADRLYDALYQDYCFITTRVTSRERQLVSVDWSQEYGVTPLIEEGRALFVGVRALLDESVRLALEEKVGLEVIAVPMEKRSFEERNIRLYAS